MSPGPWEAMRKERSSVEKTCADPVRAEHLDSGYGAHSRAT